MKRTLLFGIAVGLAVAWLWRTFARDPEPSSRVEATQVRPEPQPSPPPLAPRPAQPVAEPQVRPATNAEQSKRRPWEIARTEPPRRSSRPPEEWQGMMVDEEIAPPCESSTTCGLARACVRGVCLGCVSDGECLDGERCVLQHCVRAENVHCRSKTECPDGEVCLLTEYAATPRGNESIISACTTEMQRYLTPPAP